VTPSPPTLAALPLAQQVLANASQRYRRDQTLGRAYGALKAAQRLAYARLKMGREPMPGATKGRPWNDCTAEMTLTLCESVASLIKSSKRKKPPKARHCVYCGDARPRVVVDGGFAHRYCIPRLGEWRGGPQGRDMLAKGMEG